MTRGSEYIDYAHEGDDDPIWLRQQREQAAEAQVGLSALPPDYDLDMQIAELNVEKVRRRDPRPDALTDADVRAIEHPEGT